MTRKGVTVAALALAMMVTAAAAVRGDVFPPGGTDNWASTRATLKARFADPLHLGDPAYASPAVVFTFDGPLQVSRSDPFADTSMGGNEAINTLMMTMDMTGGGGGYQADLDLYWGYAPEGPYTRGMIIDTNPDPADSFPAYSFFDVFFEVDITAPPMGLPLHNRDPMRMESMIDEIPPDISYSVNPYTGKGWIPRSQFSEGELYNPITPIDEDDPATWLPMWDPSETNVYAWVVQHPMHFPEPSTIALLATGGLALLLLTRRRR